MVPKTRTRRPEAGAHEGRGRTVTATPGGGRRQKLETPGSRNSSPGSRGFHSRLQPDLQLLPSRRRPTPDHRSAPPVELGSGKRRSPSPL